MALIQEHYSFLQICNSHSTNPHKFLFRPSKNPPFLQNPATRHKNRAKFRRIPATRVSNAPKNPTLPPNAAKIANCSEILRACVRHLRKFAILRRKEASWCKFLIPMALASLPVPSAAAESDGKISIESIVVAIDDLNNRNPLFVTAVAFVWLVGIPLTQEYLKKCKPVSAIDAFGKLRGVPEAQLLDIRRKNSVRFMASPNLKLLGKSTVLVEFDEDDEEGFVREVLGRFPDPANTVVCVLDNFDGNSLKVAELLFKNGFKEAYAIRGGLRGTDGWQAIQEKFLPISLHVFPRKKKSKKLAHVDAGGDRIDDQSMDEGKALTSTSSSLVNATNEEDGHENLNSTTSA